MKYLAITAVLCLILAGASFAGNVTMTEVITGGDLTLTIPESTFSFPSLTLGGHSYQTTVYTVYNWAVEDSRGTGAGWNVGLSIGQFVTAGTPQRSLSADYFQIRPTVSSVVWGQSQDLTQGPIEIVGLADIRDTETKCIRANAGYGMGKYQFYTYNSLYVFATNYAGTYTATLTATLNNTP